MLAEILLAYFERRDSLVSDYSDESCRRLKYGD